MILLHKSQTLNIPKLFRPNDPRCEEQCDIGDWQWQNNFKLTLKNVIMCQTQCNNVIFKSSYNYSETLLYLCKYITAANCKYYIHIYGRNNTIIIITCLSKFKKSYDLPLDLLQY